MHLCSFQTFVKGAISFPTQKLEGGGGDNSKYKYKWISLKKNERSKISNINDTEIEIKEI